MEGAAASLFRDGIQVGKFPSVSGGERRTFQLHSRGFFIRALPETGRQTVHVVDEAKLEPKHSSFRPNLVDMASSVYRFQIVPEQRTLWKQMM
jgi:hypothetical protein